MFMGHLCPKGTLDLVVPLDLPTKLIHIVVGQIGGPSIRIHARLAENQLGTGRSDAVDVRQRDLDPLFLRKINTRDTCHTPFFSTVSEICYAEGESRGYPWRCLCLGLRLQMIRTTPRRRTTLQCSHIGLTLLPTFISRASLSVSSRACNDSERALVLQGITKVGSVLIRLRTRLDLSGPSTSTIAQMMNAIVRKDQYRTPCPLAPCEEARKLAHRFLSKGSLLGRLSATPLQQSRRPGGQLLRTQNAGHLSNLYTLRGSTSLPIFPG